MVKRFRQNTRYLFLASFLASFVAAGEEVPAPKQEAPVVLEKVVIDKIWSAVRVGFCLLTHGDRQYVAYYNADRHMVVGMRKLSDKTFTLKVLPSSQGWDSHNYLTMAVDETGCLHLSGNMHVVPLVYFRSETPGDVTTMEQVKSMVEKNEKRCTYPHFMKAPDGPLLFHYRDGTSGNGDEIYNVYDAETKTWRRYLDTPLIAGRGKCNAYQNGPRLGPDGGYHLLWLWRDTPDAATCHDLSYARSRDLKHWETAAGESLKLPITPADTNTIIDPVPVHGGVLNTCHRFGFDSHDRVVVTYYKYDRDGNSQAYAARFEDGKWRIRQISDWHSRHLFHGGGAGPATFGTSLHLGTIQRHGEGELALPFDHWKQGRGLLVIDEETLEPIGVEAAARPPARFPPALGKVQSGFPGMQVHWRGDSGSAPDPASRYVLRWETLGTNRDRPRKGPLPPDSDLVLYKIGPRPGTP